MLAFITPCYNSGGFLREAIQSVKDCSITDFEIIIADDGSTDIDTLAYLDELMLQGITVISQQNLGPAAARNTAVKHSKAEFLLFLDSDNLIKPEYPAQALAILEKYPAIAIVYARPVFFGATTEAERFNVEPFSLDRLLIGNYIDMCSVIRRKVWEDVGGFDNKRVLTGREDWDFWIRAARKGWGFHLLDAELFYYRVRNDSVSTSVMGDRQKDLVSYVSAKNHDIIFARYKYYFRLYKSIQRKPFIFFMKFIYSKFILGKDYIPKDLGKESHT